MWQCGLVTESDASSRGAVEVRLLGLPLRLRARLSQQMESLLREFALILVREEQPDHTSLPRTLLEMAVELETTYAPYRAQRAQAMDDALAAGQEHFDAVYQTSTASRGYVEHLLDVLERADEFCRAEGHLLTLPAPDDLVAFRRWLFGQIVGQLSGGTASPWPAGTGTDEQQGAASAPAAAPVVTTVDHGATDAVDGLVDEPLVLESVATAVAGARRHVREILRRLGAEDLEESAELGVSELATNAMLHARTTFSVSVRTTGQGRVRVEVHDSSPVPLQLRRFGLSATTGRGLRLVASVSSAWGIEVSSGTGKTVWFEPAALDAEAGRDAPAEWTADVEELLRA